MKAVSEMKPLVEDQKVGKFIHDHFNSPGIELNVLENGFDPDAVVVFDRGVVDKSLTINGHNQQIEELRITACLVKNTISVFNLEAKRIKINAKAKNIILLNVNADELEIEGTVSRLIIIDNLINQDSNIKMKGNFGGIILRNLDINTIDLRESESEFIKANELKSKSLQISLTEAVFKKLTIKCFSLIEKKHNKNYYCLKNSFLKL